MKISLTVTLIAIACGTSIAEETVSPSRQELLEGMRRATAFYVDEVFTHGGYVYYYALISSGDGEKERRRPTRFGCSHRGRRPSAWLF